MDHRKCIFILQAFYGGSSFGRRQVFWGRRGFGEAQEHPYTKTDFGNDGRNAVAEEGLVRIDDLGCIQDPNYWK
jgi:hypothetical protein